MNNIEYYVSEKDNKTNNNNINNINIDICFNNFEFKDNEFLAQCMNYDLNYPLKYINNIMDYYNIKKSKLNKKTMIEKIVYYENNPENFFNVYERKRLFDNYIELKNNKFFSKFIINQF